MTAITEGLKVIHIKRSTSLVDGDYVVDHLGRAKHSILLAFLAERILQEFESSERAPPPALVEVGVVMGKSREGFFLRKPRALCMLLDAGHGYFLNRMGRP